LEILEGLQGAGINRKDHKERRGEGASCLRPAASHGQRLWLGVGFVIEFERI
jgi:hypothetical protein